MALVGKLRSYAKRARALLDGAWRTRSDVASVLLHAVELASTTNDLEAAFPHAMQQSKIPFGSVVAHVALIE